MNELSIIDWLLSNSRTIDNKEIPSLKKWKNLFFNQTGNWQNTVDMAISGGFISDRTAYAFASGYWSALYCLIPSLPKNKITALCNTEQGGGHPKAIKTELIPARGRDESLWMVNGSKNFVTCANEADLLLIVATTGVSSTGQNKLRLVRVDSHTPGLLIKPLEDLPFIPEISHGKLEINSIEIMDSQILPGDGYITYIKPFRTLEDLHVNAAVAAYIFRTACLYDWPRTIKEQLLALLASIKTVLKTNPLESTVHITLGGINTLFSHVLESIDPYWKLTDDKTRSQWERDKTLLNMGGKAQSQRLSTAWARYES